MVLNRKVKKPIDLQKPKISVFIPYYNDDVFLKESIKSVLKQTFKDFELILINHASTDKSREIAHSFKDYRIKHIDLETNAGGGGGILLLEALKIANAEFFKPFCADDIMLPNCLEVLYQTIIDHPKINVCFADKMYIDKHGVKLKTFKLFGQQEVTGEQVTWINLRPRLQAMVKQNTKIATEVLLKELIQGVSFLPWITVMVKTDLLRNLKTDLIFKLLIDMTYWIQIFYQEDHIIFLNKVICKYRVHDNQLSGSDAPDRIDWNTVVFESGIYPSYFTELADVRNAKRILETQFASSLVEGEKELVPFVFAHHFIFSENPIYKAYGLQKMYYILHNKEIAEKIKHKFNFGVREFREIISRTEVNKLFKDFKVTISDINQFKAKDLMKGLMKKIKNRIRNILFRYQ